MSRVTISPAPALSLPALNRLFASAVVNHFDYFPDHIQRRVIRDHSVLQLLRAKADPRRVILTARENGRIIGYAIGAAPRTGPAQMFWLFVHPDHRGHNTGLSLLSRMLKTLAAKGAREVSIATHTHRSYYERQGFRFVEHTLVDGVPMDILVFKLASHR